MNRLMKAELESWVFLTSMEEVKNCLRYVNRNEHWIIKDTPRVVSWEFCVCEDLRPKAWYDRLVTELRLLPMKQGSWKAVYFREDWRLQQFRDEYQGLGYLDWPELHGLE